MEELIVNWAMQSVSEVTEETKDAFLNFLGAALSGATSHSVDCVVKTCLENAQGPCQPLGRKEFVSFADQVLINCFSSAIQAYDDIHFQTTTHPCGPVASAIIGISQMQRITLNEALEALQVGMEVSCRMAVLMLDAKAHSASGWYPTGITGGIGAAVACGRLLKFDRDHMGQAMALAANYAAGTRGTHGSMAGSFVPAIAAGAGFQAAMLIKNGFTCSMNALTGKNGLIAQICQTPAIALASGPLEPISCKPYPYGFIAFAPIACAMALSEKAEQYEDVTLIVSPRVASLGFNAHPVTMYDGFVSLPYIVSRVLMAPETAYQPLPDVLTFAKGQRDLMASIRIIADASYTDSMATLRISDGHQTYDVTCQDVPGSSALPMSHEDIIAKFVKISGLTQPDVFLHHYYEEDVDDLAAFLSQFKG